MTSPKEQLFERLKDWRNYCENNRMIATHDPSFWKGSFESAEATLEFVKAYFKEEQELHHEVPEPHSEAPDDLQEVHELIEENAKRIKSLDVVVENLVMDFEYDTDTVEELRAEVSDLRKRLEAVEQRPLLYREPSTSPVQWVYHTGPTSVVSSTSGNAYYQIRGDQ